MATTLVAGATGLVGTALVAALEARGDRVRRLVRGAAGRPGDHAWDPASGRIPSEAFDGVDAVVNLCGAGIADARWTRERRRLIRSSRVEPTHLLAETCARRGVPVLVGTSATGFYGDRGDEVLDEGSPSGGGFLADTCIAWERALRPAEEGGVRVVRARLGVVLSARGGALATMLPAFRWGLGGPLGSGNQWFPWIHRRDAVAAIVHLLDTESCRGAHLLVSPEACRQKDFARALGKALGRPAFLPAPGRILTWVLGSMAKELLLASQRCRPAGLLGEGFAWKHGELGAALEEIVAIGS